MSDAACTVLSTKWPEGGSRGIQVVFTDENGDELTPSVITWTLSKRGGTIINSRDQVPVSPTASTIVIVPYGDDLINDDGDLDRFLLIEFVYTSDLGTDLPGTHQVEFSLKDFPAITS